MRTTYPVALSEGAWCHLQPSASGTGWVCDRHGFYVYLANHNRHHPVHSAAIEFRDQRIKELSQQIRDLSRYATHESGCPAIGAAGDCDCGVEEFWDHG